MLSGCRECLIIGPPRRMRLLSLCAGLRCREIVLGLRINFHFRNQNAAGITRALVAIASDAIASAFPLSTRAAQAPPKPPPVSLAPKTPEIDSKISARASTQEILQSGEGDYALWLPGVPHYWSAEEDAVIVTVRWPSVSGDSSGVKN